MYLYKNLSDLVFAELVPLMDGYDNLPDGEVPGKAVKQILDRYQYLQLAQKVVVSCVYLGERWYSIDPSIKDLQTIVDQHRIDFGEESTLDQRCDRCGAQALVEVLTSGGHVLFLCGSHARMARLDDAPDVLAHKTYQMKEV